VGKLCVSAFKEITHQKSCLLVRSPGLSAVFGAKLHHFRTFLQKPHCLYKQIQCYSDALGCFFDELNNDEWHFLTHHNKVPLKILWRSVQNFLLG